MQVINHIKIRGDTAYIRDTGKKAEMVARMYVGTDYTIKDVMAHYDLDAADVHAAIAYYYDNQAELDARHQAARQYAAENTLTQDELKARIAKRKFSDEAGDQ